MQPQTTPTNHLTTPTIHLNPLFSPHSVSTGSLLSPQDHLYFCFEIKPLTQIRLLSDNNKNILKLTLGDIAVSVVAVKDSGEYVFEEGRYRNYVVVELGREGKGKQGVLEIGRKEIWEGNWTRVVVSIDRVVEFGGKDKWEMEECYPVIQFGSMDAKRVFQCKIQGIKLTNTKQTIPTKQIKAAKEYKQLHDGPLDTIPTTKIPNYKDLPQYRSPEAKQDKLYFCHDMAGGYIQDTNRHHPYPQQKNKYTLNPDYQNTFRSLHLAQATIFNYFSHHLITIPPKHWRRACKATKTLCLGTFIIQTDRIPPETYLSPYTITLLAYLCRLYKFDGYLLNLQHKISTPNLLLPWLTQLVQQLHTAVPGSQVIWYDSVVMSGSVSYQNQLNQKNGIFYEICDGIFLNYWWDQAKLGRSVGRWIQGKGIYVGSDCFGRGTYGGGGYNTYKAIQAIKKADNGLNAVAPALFAIGYTYELQKKNIESWKINQKCLYRGMSQYKQQIPHSSWQYLNQNVNGFKWQIQNEWAVTSFQTCRRQCSFNLNHLRHHLPQPQSQSSPNLTLIFFTTVSGTGPNFQDPYKITIILSLYGQIINECTTKELVASQKEAVVELKMAVDGDLVTEDTVVTVVQEGHDVEKWGGFYGSRFKGDQLWVVAYDKDNDWIARYKTNFPQGLPLPYLTFYNQGNGQNFHIKGQAIKKSYDFLSDCDPNYTYLMNPPLNVSINYSDAYMGGTCLMVQNTLKLKLVEVCVGGEKEGKVCCRVVVKSLGENQNKRKFGIGFRLGKGVGEGRMLGEEVVRANWVIYQFEIDLPQSTNQNDKLTLYLQSTTNSPYLLGQTAIYQKTPNPNPTTTTTPTIQNLTTTISQHNPPISPIFFNCTIRMSCACRVLVVYGEGFGCFGWADQLNGNTVKIDNIYATTTSKNNYLKIYALDCNLIFQQLQSIPITPNSLTKTS